MSEPGIQLSPRGEQRRASILHLALRESRARQRRRLATRVGIVAFIGAVAFFGIPRRQEIAPPPPAVAVVPSAPKSNITVEYIQTDPTIVDRLSIRPQPTQGTQIDDDELLQALASIGQPAGIIRVGDEITLMPHGRHAEE